MKLKKETDEMKKEAGVGRRIFVMKCVEVKNKVEGLS